MSSLWNARKANRRLISALFLLLWQNVYSFIVSHRSSGFRPLSTALRSTEEYTSTDKWGGLHSSEQEEHLQRFSGVGRLYADEKVAATGVVEQLQAATVAIVGLGGVGSWSAEALCRSGVGNLILIDLDDICISNTNRQLHTTTNSIGQMKIDAMKSRMTDINPNCNVTLIHDFVMIDNIESLFEKIIHADVILDAIDGSDEKAAIMAMCVDHSVPVVTVGGAAGKADSGRILRDDIVRVKDDKLIAACRRHMRKLHGFRKALPRSSGKTPRKWNIPTIYSLEPQKVVSASESDTSSFRKCDGALGTVCHVTGTFGFMAAGVVTEILLAGDGKPIPRRG